MGDDFNTIPFFLKSGQQLILDYCKLASTGKEELQQLNDEIEILKATVEDVLMVQDKGEHLKEWLRQVREFIFDIKETMVASLTQAAREKNSYLIQRMFNKTKIDLAEKVKSWRSNVKDKQYRGLDLLENQPKTISSDDSSSLSTEQMEKGALAVTSSLNSAVNLINHYEKHIPAEAHQDLKDMKEELESMAKFVECHHRGKDEEKYEFKIWVELVTEVIVEVEDTITTFAVAQQKSAKLRRSSMNRVNAVTTTTTIGDFWQNKVAPAFRDAKTDFEGLPTRCRSVRSTIITCGNRKKPTRENAGVYTYQRKMDSFIADLHSESSENQIFAIAGVQGLGKTTLARNIYRREVRNDKFPIVIWAIASEDFNKKEMLLTILKSLDVKEEELQRKSYDSLVTMVGEKLIGRFLICIDDVRDTTAWDQIQDMLPLDSNKQGRVLITTRDLGVAWHATKRPHSTVEPLSTKISWKLLQLQVFGSLNSCPQELQEIGDEIAQSCCGLPFAIVVIGAVLREKWEQAAAPYQEVVEEWKKVSLSVKRYVITKGVAGPWEMKNCMLGIVSLSYNTLSHELKRCFLYLGIFPEDSVIQVRKLINLWVAEGYIHHQEGRSLEEIGLDYVMDLIEKNLLMVDENVKLDHTVKSCRVHSLVHHFCKRNASHLFQEIKVTNQGVLEPGLEEIKACRRICIYSSLEKFLRMTPKPTLKAHSLLSSSKPVEMGKKDLPSISNNGFNLLRILDIDTAVKFYKFPNELTQLVLLKYVTLSGVGFSILPEEIYNLWNVRTLEVYTSMPTLAVKASSIWKMIRLRNFKTKASIILDLKDGKEQDGENFLLTFNRLSPQSCTSEVLRKSKKLRSLGIRGELGKLLDCNSCNLSELEELEKLKLLIGSSPEEAKYIKRCGVPKINWFPKNLKTLVMSGTYLEWRHMTTLGKIATLRVLKLKDYAFTGNEWLPAAGDHGGFNSLESLHIFDTDLASWKLARGSLGSLKNLVLRNCEKLKEVPDHLVRQLELLHMENVSKNASGNAEASKRKIIKELGKEAKLKLVIIPKKDDYKPVKHGSLGY